mmetsp:Transcript_28697/g.72148  ORF Transcript_28697/g.72148 Transcript_28697/m.72148 type:complete len:229 (+) Transcript_28697:672-1358(+)
MGFIHILLLARDHCVRKLLHSCRPVLILFLGNDFGRYNLYVFNVHVVFQFQLGHLADVGAEGIAHRLFVGRPLTLSEAHCCRVLRVLKRHILVSILDCVGDHGKHLVVCAFGVAVGDDEIPRPATITRLVCSSENTFLVSVEQRLLHNDIAFKNRPPDHPVVLFSDKLAGEAIKLQPTFVVVHFRFWSNEQPHSDKAGVFHFLGCFDSNVHHERHKADLRRLECCSFS